VAPRRRQQRYVVADALVAIRAAEIEDLRATDVHEPGIGQVLAPGHDLGAGNRQRPEAGVVDDDENGHGFWATRG